MQRQITLPTKEISATATVPVAAVPTDQKNSVRKTLTEEELTESLRQIRIQVGTRNAKAKEQNRALGLLEIIMDTAAIDPEEKTPVPNNERVDSLEEDSGKKSDRPTIIKSEFDKYYATTPELNVANSLRQTAFNLACSINPAAADWIIDKAADKNYKGKKLLINEPDANGIHALTHLVSSRPVDSSKSENAVEQKKDALRQKVFAKLLPLVLSSLDQATLSTVLGKTLVQAAKTGNFYAAEAIYKAAYTPKPIQSTIAWVVSSLVSSAAEVVLTEADLREAAGFALLNGNAELAKKLFDKLKNKAAGMLVLLEHSHGRDKDQLLAWASYALAEDRKFKDAFKKQERASQLNATAVYVSPIHGIVSAFCQGRWKFNDAVEAITKFTSTYGLTYQIEDLIPIIQAGSIEGIKLWRTCIGTNATLDFVPSITEKYAYSDGGSFTKTNTVTLSVAMLFVLKRQLTKNVIKSLRDEYKVDLTQSFSFQPTYTINYICRSFPDMPRDKKTAYNLLDVVVGMGDIRAVKDLLTLGISKRLKPHHSFVDFLATTFSKPSKERAIRAELAGYLVDIYHAAVNNERADFITALNGLKKLTLHKDEEIRFLNNLLGENKLWQWAVEKKLITIPVPISITEIDLSSRDSKRDVKTEAPKKASASAVTAAATAAKLPVVRRSKDSKSVDDDDDNTPKNYAISTDYEAAIRAAMPADVNFDDVSDVLRGKTTASALDVTGASEPNEAISELNSAVKGVRALVDRLTLGAPVHQSDDIALLDTIKPDPVSPLTDAGKLAAMKTLIATIKNPKCQGACEARIEFAEQKLNDKPTAAVSVTASMSPVK